MSADLNCFYRDVINVTSSARLFAGKAILNNPTTVNCGKVSNLAGKLYQVGLVFERQQKSIV
jgi:hypothetical protein